MRLWYLRHRFIRLAIHVNCLRCFFLPVWLIILESIKNLKYIYLQSRILWNTTSTLYILLFDHILENIHGASTKGNKGSSLWWNRHAIYVRIFSVSTSRIFVHVQCLTWIVNGFHVWRILSFLLLYFNPGWKWNRKQYT